MVCAACRPYIRKNDFPILYIIINENDSSAIGYIIFLICFCSIWFWKSDKGISLMWLCSRKASI